MGTRSAVTTTGIVIAAIVLAAIAAGLAALLRIDLWGESGSGLSPRFTYDLEQYQKTDPGLVGYGESCRIAVDMQEPRAVAVGPEDRICVAGDRAILIFAADGTKLREISTEEEPWCLAVGGPQHAFPGRVYAGMKTHLLLYGPNGTREAAWDSPGKKALLTSVALSEAEVFVADAGQRIVLRYDLSGKLLGRIGQRDEAHGIPGFVIPSPYFDVAVAPDGLLRAVNPGAHRVEAYTPDGYLELAWGKPSIGMEGFCGCCNPANIALLPDGRIVTAEKGIPRVKVYTSEGQFVCVVAGPETLLPTPTSNQETRWEHKLKVIDVAADSRGRVLVLDPGTRSVRIFEPSRTNPKTGS